MGIKHPDYLELTSRELAEWQAYYKIEPFGVPVQNLQIGRFMALVANMMSKKGSRKFVASDFAIGFEKVVKKQSVKEMAKTLKSAFGKNAKRIKRKKD